MASKPPDAFLSYTRFDDQHDGGAISEFRTRLANAVRAVTGEPFEIFQDVDGIGLGEHWPGKLDRLLDEVRFFIPILTPSYFQSNACRDELEKFLKAEKDRGRNDLVLPIYYIRCTVMEDPVRRSNDSLAGVLHERERWDWRALRFKPTRHPSIRKSLEALAWKIDEAVTRAKRLAEEKTQKRADVEARRKEENRQVEEKPRREAEDAAAIQGLTAAQPRRDDRAVARRGFILRPLTDEEKSARVRAFARAKRAEEEARRRAEAYAERLAEEAAAKRDEEARKKAEEEARKRVEEGRPGYPPGGTCAERSPALALVSGRCYAMSTRRGAPKSW